MTVMFHLKTPEGIKNTFKFTKNTKRTVEVLNSQGNVYELLNEETGLGVEKFVAKRAGNDLELYLFKKEESEITEKDKPSVVIKDYYIGEQLNPILGLGENGVYHQYITEGVAESAVSSLKDNVLAVQILDNSAKFSLLDYWYVGSATGVGILAAAFAGAGSSDSRFGGGYSVCR